MRNYFLNYTAVGIFVTAMVVALVWALAEIAGRTGPTDNYAIVMDNVTDVDYGTLIRYEGYPVGQVEAIIPEWTKGKYRFRVVVSVEKDWKFPVDSVARISASSFLAAKTIEVKAGESTTLVAVGGEIPSGPPADVFSLMADVAAEIGDLSQNSLKPLLAQIGETIDSLGSKTEANLDELFNNLIAISDEIEKRAPEITEDIMVISDQVQKELNQVDKFLSDGNAKSVSQTLANLEKASADATTVSADVKEVAAKIKALTDDLHKMIADNRGNVDRSVADLEYILRSVSQNIDTLTHNLDGTARNLNEFSRLIRQSPGLLLSGGSPQPDTGLTPSGSSEP